MTLFQRIRHYLTHLVPDSNAPENDQPCVKTVSDLSPPLQPPAPFSIPDLPTALLSIGRDRPEPGWRPDPNTLRLWQSLTPQEKEILVFICRFQEGVPTQARIASSFSCSPHTIKTHLRHIYRKLAMSNKDDLRRCFSGLDFSSWNDPYRPAR